MAEAKTGLEGDLRIYAGTINWSGTNVITGTRVGFAQGVAWNWDTNMVPIHDRGTFSHWKKGRGKGELTVPTIYVDNMLDLTAFAGGTVTGSSAERLQAELMVYGTSGVMEHTVQFSDIAQKHFEMNEPEGDEPVTWSCGFDLKKIPVHAVASRIT